MRRLLVLAAVAALWGLLATALAPVAAAPASRQVAVGVAPETPDDPASTSADPSVPAGRAAWQVALVGGTSAAGAALRAPVGVHPVHARLVSSGSSSDPDPRSRQHISPLTVSLRI